MDIVVSSLFSFKKNFFIKVEGRGNSFFFHNLSFDFFCHRRRNEVAGRVQNKQRVCLSRFLKFPPPYYSPIPHTKNSPIPIPYICYFWHWHYFRIQIWHQKIPKSWHNICILHYLSYTVKSHPAHWGEYVVFTSTAIDFLEKLWQFYWDRFAKLGLWKMILILGIWGRIQFLWGNYFNISLKVWKW